MYGFCVFFSCTIYSIRVNKSPKFLQVVRRRGSPTNIHRYAWSRTTHSLSFPKLPIPISRGIFVQIGGGGEEKTIKQSIIGTYLSQNTTSFPFVRTFDSGIEAGQMMVDWVLQGVFGSLHVEGVVSFFGFHSV